MGLQDDTLRLLGPCGALPRRLCLLLLVWSTYPLVHANRLIRTSGPALPSARLGSGMLVGDSVAIHDQLDCSYLADINIGDQTFQVILDTGSSDLWVVSSNCTDGDCKKVSLYNDSSSLRRTEEPFILNYLAGGVTGNVAYETVKLGRYRIQNQTIALANHTNGLNLGGSGYSGIMGLSFPSEASIASSAGQTLLVNLLSPLPDDRKFFAVRLSKEETASSLTIGELDTALGLNVSLADFAFSNVLPRPGPGGVYDYWKIHMQELTIDGVSLPFSESKVPGSHVPVVVLDTGTTLILGPTSDVDRLWKATGVAKKNSGGQWFVKCNRAAVVRLKLGDGDHAKEYVLDPTDVNWAKGGREGGWCLGGIQANDHVNSGDWLLGDGFLRNVYVTHHTTVPPKIGLLSVTNVTKALAAFQADRGTDSSSPVTVIHPVEGITKAEEHRSGPVYAGSLMAGFLIGAGLMYVGIWSQGYGRKRLSQTR